MRYQFDVYISVSLSESDIRIWNTYIEVNNGDSFETRFLGILFF